MKEAPFEPGQERDVGAAEATAEGEVVLAARAALVMVVRVLDLVDLVEVILVLRDLARTSAPMLKAGMFGLALSGGAGWC